MFDRRPVARLTTPISIWRARQKMAGNLFFHGLTRRRVVKADSNQIAGQDFVGDSDGPRKDGQSQIPTLEAAPRLCTPFLAMRFCFLFLGLLCASFAG